MESIDVVMTIDGNVEKFEINKRETIRVYQIKILINTYLGYLIQEGKIPENRLVANISSPSFQRTSLSKNIFNLNNYEELKLSNDDEIRLTVTTSSPVGGRRRRKTRSRKSRKSRK